MVGALLWCCAAAALPAQSTSVPVATTDTVFACEGERVTLAAPEGFPRYLWSVAGGRNLSGAASIDVRARGTRTYLLTSQASTGPNLAANPAFDGGPGVGFESAYTARAEVIEEPGEYVIAPAPDRVNPGFTFCFDADRDPSAGVMMLLLTDPDPGRLVYRQRVRVPNDSAYLVSVTGIHVSRAPCELRVDLNGERGAGTLALSLGPCSSDQATFLARPDAAGDIEIEIYNVGPGGAGLGIDGVVVAEQPPPRFDTVTVVALGADATRLTPGVCPGEAFETFDGQRVVPGDSLVLTLRNRGGCDSVVTVVPRVLGGAPDTLATRRLCAGETTEVFGQTIGADAVVCEAFATATGCDSVVCVPVDVFEAADVTAATTADACRDAHTGAVRLALPPAGAPYAVSWDGAPATAADTSRSGLPAGTYRLRVTDAGGCTADVVAVVPEGPPLAWESFAEALGPCDTGDARGVRLALTGGNVGNVGTGAYTLEAIPPAGAADTVRQVHRIHTDPLHVSFPAAGTWGLSATDATGCAIDTVLLVTPTPVPLIDGPAALLPGDAVAFRLLGLAPYGGEVTWTLPGRPPVVLPLGARYADTAAGAGLVRADILLDDGCALAAVLQIGQREVRLYPTAFSPNGDGLHDRFAPLPSVGVERVVELRVYDRWGGLLYGAGDCGPGGCTWDVGADAVAGVYVYVARARLRDGSEVRVAGEVTLVR